MCKRLCLCCSYTVLHSEFCYKRGEGSKFEICATICENDMIVPGKIYTLCCVLTCVHSVTNAGIKHSQLIVEIYWYFKVTLLTPSFRNHIFSNYHVLKHLLTNLILSSFYSAKVKKSTAKNYGNQFTNNNLMPKTNLD